MRNYRKKKKNKQRKENIIVSMMLDHLLLDNNFDDLITVYFLDYNNLLFELVLELVFLHLPLLIDQDDLLSRNKIILNKQKDR